MDVRAMVEHAIDAAPAAAEPPQAPIATLVGCPCCLYHGYVVGGSIGGCVGSAPDIIPISDLRRDTAGIIGRAVASGEPVYITQHGRATAVLVSRTEYEHLLRRLEILGRLTAGDTGVAPSSGSSLVEIRERATQKPTLVDTEFGLVDPATAALLTAEGFAVRPPVVPCEASPADEDESPGVVR